MRSNPYQSALCNQRDSATTISTLLAHHSCFGHLHYISTKKLACHQSQSHVSTDFNGMGMSSGCRTQNRNVNFPRDSALPNHVPVLAAASMRNVMRVWPEEPSGRNQTSSQGMKALKPPSNNFAGLHFWMWPEPCWHWGLSSLKTQLVRSNDLLREWIKTVLYKSRMPGSSAEHLNTPKCQGTSPPLPFPFWFLKVTRKNVGWR